MKNRHSIVSAAYLLLIKDKKVLLSRRFNTGYEDGKYSVPAGHVEAGESVADALVREAKEEIGIDVKKEDVTLAHVMHRKAIGDKSDERLDFFFMVEKYDGEIKNEEPQKCDDLSWFEMNHLPENIIPYIRQGIESAGSHRPYSELNW